MEKRIWNQLKKAVMITAAVGILGAGAVSAAEFEAPEPWTEPPKSFTITLAPKLANRMA